MAGLQDIRRRIRSVKNTQQVTKAMKMISAVKLRKSQERLFALRPYSGRLLEVVRRVVARFEAPASGAPLDTLAQAFVAPREERRCRLVLVASDKGLCGGFNANALKTAQAFLKDSRSELAALDAVGKRAVDWARRSGLKASTEHLAVALPALPEVARGLARQAMDQYLAGEIDALYVVYNAFHSPVSQVPTIKRIFPVEAERRAEASAEEIPHLLEPDPQTVLAELFPRFVEMEVLRCLLESAASEHGARMASMDKATNNAAEMIDTLTLNMNKARQAAITNQIIEVVSGANA